MRVLNLALKATTFDVLPNSPKLSQKFPYQQVGRVLFFVLNKLIYMHEHVLFSLPNNLFCVDNVRRIDLLIKIKSFIYSLFAWSCKEAIQEHLSVIVIIIIIVTFIYKALNQYLLLALYNFTNKKITTVFYNSAEIKYIFKYKNFQS